MPRVIVFDVNETLLDLSALDPEFDRAFGAASVRREWFTQVLQLAFVSVATDRHADFGTVGRAALAMVAERHGADLSTDDAARILGGMRRLPPHPEVPAALARLRDAGLRLAALTNSPKDAADAQLTHAGLFDFFEQVLSVDFAGRLKPHPAVYRMGAERLGAAPAGMRMVAAHHWDVTGAIRAGCAGAFVARPGMVLGPLDERPDVVGPDLAAVAESILLAEAVC